MLPDVMNNIWRDAVGFLRTLSRDITAYDLFALTVASMILGHMIAFFYGNEPVLLRIPDRIMLPVFLVSIGFNAGKKPGRVIWVGGAVIFFCHYYLTGVVIFHIPILILIILYTIEPLMRVLLKSKFWFWAGSFLIFLLSYHSLFISDVGTMSLLFAMAGWLNVNRSVVPQDVVKPWHFFVFCYFLYSVFVRFELTFNFTEAVVFQIGSAFVFWLLYDFRRILLNSLRRRPRDVIEKLCHFMGHRSMEIYVVQQIFFIVTYVFYMSLEAS